MDNLNICIPKERIRRNVAAIFLISALCFSSWTSRISYIQENLNLDDGRFGLLLFCLPFGVLLSLPISSNLTRKFGSKPVLIFGIIGLMITLIMLSFVKNLYITGFCLILFGFSNNATNLTANLQAAQTERLFGKSIMGSFHGIWSVSALLGSLFGSLCMSKHIPMSTQFFVITVVAAIVLFTSYRNLINENRTDEQSTIFAFKIKNKSVLILGLIALCAMIGEGSMYDWSEIYLKRTVQSNHFMSSLGYSTFMFAMMTGRFGSDLSVRKFGLHTTLTFAGLLSVLGFLICAISELYVIILLGYFFIGLGTSAVVPVVYGTLAKIGRDKLNQYITTISSISFLGLLFAPPFIGIIAQNFSIRTAFVCLLIISSLIILLSKRLRSDRSGI